jgi:hypothetical protein
MTFLVAFTLYVGASTAFAVDTGDTDGPATKISDGASGTQNKGSEGFFDHNGNGTRGWTSWVNRDDALEVNPEYAFKPYKESTADDYGPATTTGHFGTTNRTGFEDAIKDN